MNKLPKIRTELQTKNPGGAPKGNRNALKAGLHTKQWRDWRAQMLQVIRRAKQTLADAQ